MAGAVVKVTASKETGGGKKRTHACALLLHLLSAQDSRP